MSIYLNEFEKFLQHREMLINLYIKGDLSKDEFIEENYNYISSSQIKPFKKIDSIKKAMFNYQYYNSIAKYYQKLLHDAKKSDPKRLDYIELCNYYYSKKDHTTLAILKHLDFQGIEAYFVKANSPNLKNKLYEIVFKDEDNLIFHSKNPTILNMLRQENVFIEDERKSLIDNYVNERF